MGVAGKQRRGLGAGRGEQPSATGEQTALAGARPDEEPLYQHHAANGQIRPIPEERRGSDDRRQRRWRSVSGSASGGGWQFRRAGEHEALRRLDRVQAEPRRRRWRGIDIRGRDGGRRNGSGAGPFGERIASPGHVRVEDVDDSVGSEAESPPSLSFSLGAD